jgi:hypothetical protein
LVCLNKEDATLTSQKFRSFSSNSLLYREHQSAQFYEGKKLPLPVILAACHTNFHAQAPKFFAAMEKKKDGHYL